MEGSDPNDARRNRDENEHLELELPRAGRALRLVGRALTLHCPYCWDAIEIAAPLGMAVAPFLLYPVSKLLWLALDLVFRPDQQTAP